MNAKVERMLRVDQAGEYGAVRIYAGQLAVMGDRGPHLAYPRDGGAGGGSPRLFRQAGERARRAAHALQPVWHVAGFALGAATALIGPEAAMACTAAIETEIDRHYTQQLEELGEEDPELAALITRARDEEREHRDTALAAGRAGAGLSAAFRGDPAGVPAGDQTV
jgi:ubiquinone biosynthesis monooxygenase Coq7